MFLRWLHFLVIVVVVVGDGGGGGGVCGGGGDGGGKYCMCSFSLLSNEQWLYPRQ